MMDTRFLNVAGGRIAYDDQGNGPLVICVPGLGVIRSDYRLLARRLLAAGYRVVTMDPRGQGASSVGWSDYSVGAIGGDVVALARALNAGPAVIVGTSMGAGVAVWAAAEAPELFAGIALIGPAVRDGAPRWKAALMNTFLFGPLLHGPWAVGAWMSYLRSLYPTTPPDDLDTYLNAVAANLREPGRMTTLNRMITASKTASSQRLARVTIPAVVIMGTKDRDFPNPEAEARFVAEHLGRPATYHMIEGAGHYPYSEMPEVTTPIILNFLASVQAGAAHGA